MLLKGSSPLSIVSVLLALACVGLHLAGALSFLPQHGKQASENQRFSCEEIDDGKLKLGVLQLRSSQQHAKAIQFDSRSLALLGS